MQFARGRNFGWVALLALVGAFAAACGSSESGAGAAPGNAGAAGSSAAGTAGAAGSGTAGAGTAGSAGSGVAGASGSSGSAGVGGMGVEPGSPVIFYTDLASAPAGAYVTVFGRGFGSSAGATGNVTLGSDACTTLSWSDTEIEFKLPASATAGDLVVHTSAGDSPGMALGVHTGKLYFVAANGNDTWSGTLEAPAGSDGPFKTLGRGRDALAAGDVLYLRGQTFTAEDNFNAVLSLYDVPTGTAAKPVAIVSYPGEPATLGDATLARGISMYRGDNAQGLEYLTIAKIRFRPTCDAIEIIGSDHGRFVANDIGGASEACSNGVVETQGTSYWKVLGNVIHDNGNTKLEHGVYLGGYGYQHDWEIAYNKIGPQKGGRGIQLYGHLAGDHIAFVQIHDNEIFEIDRDGIVLGATDGDVLTLEQVLIYNNIFHRAGRCVGAGVRVNNQTASHVAVAHNTFYDNGAGNVACDQSTGQLGSQFLVEDGVDIVLQNNILVSTGSEAYVIQQDTPNPLLISQNLYFGNGAAPSEDAVPTSGDPQFANAANGDFHISATSPAGGKGYGIGIPIDHDGIARSPTAPAIGAYEPSP